MKTVNHTLKITKADKGKFHTLKKDVLVYKTVSGAIVQLLLPKGTKISVPRDYNQNGKYIRRKLRADQAVVMAIIPFAKVHVLGSSEKVKQYQTLDKINKKYSSKWNFMFHYQMGRLVKPANGFCSISTLACRSGIHFFLDLKDAERWF